MLQFDIFVAFGFIFIYNYEVISPNYNLGINKLEKLNLSLHFI